jgi:nucleoside-diphosphate-sugar epimerase
MIKIFVTGGSGSIGSHLIKILADRGHIVHALVRSIHNSKELQFKNVILFEGDIKDPSSIEKAMKGCQQVYHLAAFAKVWSRNSGDYYSINVGGTVNILNSALKLGVQKVVVTSTAGVFGPSIQSIVDEEKIRDIDFFNEYEGSKLAVESKIKDFIIQKGMNIVIVAPTRVYGPCLFGQPNSITLMIDKYVNGKWRIYPGTGKEIGNYIYIDDVILGHILAMEKGVNGQTYILAGENQDYISFFAILSETTGIKRKMIKIPNWVQNCFANYQLFLAKYLNKTPKITPKWMCKGKYNWEVSAQKAIIELGVPITPLAIGLQMTVDNLRKLNQK